MRSTSLSKERGPVDSLRARPSRLSRYGCCPSPSPSTRACSGVFQLFGPHRHFAVRPRRFSNFGQKAANASHCSILSFTSTEQNL